MKDSSFSTNDMVKYLIVSGLVYTILKIIPSIQMNNKDLILVLVIITIGFIMVDCTVFKKQKKEGFAQAAKDDDPFAIDLNIDIDALLKKKMEMQLAKTQAEAPKPKPKAEAPKPKAEAPKPKAEAPRFTVECAIEVNKVKRELQNEINQLKQKLNNTAILKPKSPTSETQSPSPKSPSPKSPSPKSPSPKLPSPKLPSPKSPSPKSPSPKLPSPKLPSHKLPSHKLPSPKSPSHKLPSHKLPSHKVVVNKDKKDLQNDKNNKLIIKPSNKVSSDSKIALKYFESLLNELNEKGVIDSKDVQNIQLKMKSKLLSIEEVINSLEMLKKEGKSRGRVNEGKVKNDNVYNELPSDFYTPLGDKISNEWDNDYTILNTNKWQVPMPRPPVCINTTPCKVCPSDSSNYPVNLKQWDDSRYVTQSKINKKWSDDQARA